MAIIPKNVLRDGHRFAPSEVAIFSRVTVRVIHNLGYSGLFAEEFIPKGTIIARDGGKVLFSIDDIPSDQKYCTLISENLFLAPSDYESKSPLEYLNHSCDSNTSRIGGLVYMAKRDIDSGEEINIDYAPLVAGLDNWTMNCLCGSKNCRKVVTGDDWLRPELGVTLWNEWLPHIQRKIITSQEMKK